MRILICTVGGSHAPILTSIQALKPDRVVFVCTDRDPTTNAPGSRVQIEAKGLCIKARFSDEACTLPNIPAQAGLSEGDYQVLAVPADQLDETVSLLGKHLASLRESYADAELHADYTGGTKTMSVALAWVALHHGLALRFVSGPRSNLVGVSSNQFAQLVNTAGIALQGVLAAVSRAWKAHSYGDAVNELEAFRSSPSFTILGGSEQSYLQRLTMLSTAFDAWDRFDHAAAVETLQTLAAVLPAALRIYHVSGKTILSDAQADTRLGRQAQLLKIHDVWLNALRRAAAGRYDDAVGRWYRMIEWYAQYCLRSRHQIETGNLDANVIPENLRPAPRSSDGRLVVGLTQAWSILAWKDPESEEAVFWSAYGETLRDLLLARNSSLLAHGEQPVSAAAWTRIEVFMNDHVAPLLQNAIEKAGLKTGHPQLPQELPG